MFQNIQNTIVQSLVKLDRVVTRMPGNVTFDRSLDETDSHGAIWVRSERFEGKAVMIHFRCENDAGVRKGLPYVQEEIIRQARLQGFDPIYLRCNGVEMFETTIDPYFAL